MEAYKLGIPVLNYFELFSGEHPSDKLYSVQVDEWLPGAAAVINYDLSQKQANAKEHYRVTPTEELIEFLAYRGIEIPDEVYVQPIAFTFVDEEDMELVEPEQEKTNKHHINKALLAAAIAVISLLK